ncbi:MAG: response regulator transcription factor [Vallitaleaceae bacterium]|jgi:DNA-binding response OmpR family regulator|nr:response regulator transcription factor [Vallitaleaceae bacterium]
MGKMNKILIIEDDLNIASLEKDFLEINGYVVTIIGDGQKGLKAALSGEYDLIIIDIMLPVVNGFDILMTIRDKVDIPCIVVSARVDDVDKIKGLGLGADDYMTKPFNPNELVARVNNQLSRYQRFFSKNSLVEIDLNGILINQDSRKVFVNNKEVAFTTTEFDMLLYFIQNPDIVHSKTKLFDRIWGEDEFGDIGTVAVHVQKIRKKIEKDPSNPKIIETVWGAGYRFNKY